MANNIDEFFSDKDLKNKVKALENSSKIFDENDNFDVHTMESIFAIESSFGTVKNIGIRGSDEPAGYFQQKKNSAEKAGLIVTKKNDERFDIDRSSIGSSRQLKELDNLFSQRNNLGSGIFKIAIHDIEERERIVVAAYNIGQGRIAKAQAKAQEDGKDPTKWDAIKEYLVKSGATTQQAEEAENYVEKYDQFKQEFSKKSKARNLKDKDLSTNESGDCHWITKDHKPICIPNQKTKEI